VAFTLYSHSDGKYRTFIASFYVELQESKVSDILTLSLLHTYIESIKMEHLFFFTCSTWWSIPLWGAEMGKKLTPWSLLRGCTGRYVSRSRS